MRISVRELRYRMKEVWEAVDRSEEVVLLYRGKPRGITRPLYRTYPGAIKEHSFFGSVKSAQTVEEEMDSLRGPRYRLSQGGIPASERKKE